MRESDYMQGTNRNTTTFVAGEPQVQATCMMHSGCRITIAMRLARGL